MEKVHSAYSSGVYLWRFSAQNRVAPYINYEYDDRTGIIIKCSLYTLYIYNMNSAHIFRRIKNDSQLHTHKQPPSRGQNGKQTFSSHVGVPTNAAGTNRLPSMGILQAAAVGREWQIDWALRVNTNAFHGVIWGWNYITLYRCIRIFAMTVRKRIDKCNNIIISNKTSLVINYQTNKCPEVCGWAAYRIQYIHKYTYKSYYHRIRTDLGSIAQLYIAHIHSWHAKSWNRLFFVIFIRNCPWSRFENRVYLIRF